MIDWKNVDRIIDQLTADETLKLINKLWDYLPEEQQQAFLDYHD